MNEQPDPKDIHDIVTHKPLRWMFDGSGNGIQHYSKGKWGEIRFEVGMLYGAFIWCPFTLVMMVVFEWLSK